MSEFVDFFLIVLSNTTFSGLPLLITFFPFEDYVVKYRKKIIFYNISHPRNCGNNWCREKYQRRSISKAVKSLNVSNESIVIISDIDEIPTSNAMIYIIQNPPNTLYMLSGYSFCYNYRLKSNSSWPGIIVVKASNCNKNIQNYRDDRHKLAITNSIPIYPSLTHCSFCYNSISSIQYKMKSYSHKEWNKNPYINKEYILMCVKNHIHFIFFQKLELVEFDNILLPLPNDKRFNYLKNELSIN